MNKITIEQAYDELVSKFKINSASGNIKFNLKDFQIVVKQPNVVGNIIEEWLSV